MLIFNKKNQSSLEFLIIFGISFAIILMLGGIFFSYSNGAKNTLDQKQIDKVGNEIISNIEKIYFLGNNNMITMGFKLPEGIENISILHLNISDGTTYNTYDYLNISYMSENLIVDSLFTTKENYIYFNCTNCTHSVNLNGNYTSYYNSYDYTGGTKLMKIQSKGDYVTIDFVRE